MSYRILPFILFSTLFFYQCSPKFLQVHEEPMHQLAFESKKVRVLDVRFPPGDTCFFHQHSKSYYYVAIQGGKCFVQNQGEEGRVLTLPTNYSGGKFDMPKERFIHRIANLGTDTIKFIAVENLRPKKSKSLGFKPSPVEKLVEENDKFRVTKLQLPKGLYYQLNFELPLLLVNPKSTEIGINDFKINKSWAWFEKGDRLLLKNDSKKELELIAIFLK